MELGMHELPRLSQEELDMVRKAFTLFDKDGAW